MLFLLFMCLCNVFKFFWYFLLLCFFLCRFFCVFCILASISFSFSVVFALRFESVANVLTPKSIPTSFPVLGKGCGCGESYMTIMNHWLFFSCIRMCFIFPVISGRYPLRLIHPSGFQYNLPSFLTRILWFMLLIFTDCEDWYFF